MDLSAVSLLRNECYAKRHCSNKLISLFAPAEPYPGGAEGTSTLSGDGLGYKPTINHVSTGERRQSLSMLINASVRVVTVFLFISLENMINFFKWKKLFCSESLQINTTTF